MSGVSFWKIEQFLNSLGSTPDEIADTLYLMGVRGVPILDAKCPLAVALKEEFGVRFSVGPMDVSVLGELGTISLSRELRQFVLMFDQRKYPDLIG